VHIADSGVPNTGVRGRPQAARGADARRPAGAGEAPRDLHLGGWGSDGARCPEALAGRRWADPKGGSREGMTSLAMTRGGAIPLTSLTRSR
jgi:hypothetical protein